MPGRSLRIATFPSPSGGLNSADPIDQMPANASPYLVNFFPEEKRVVTRGGTILHCATGDATRAWTLFSYSGISANALLSAHSSGVIYNVTTSVAASLATGYNSPIWSWTNFSNSAGHFLIAANDTGLDDAWYYDGATITPLVTTGLVQDQISRVCVYLQRPFYAERNSLSVWYPAAGAFQGALTELDLSSYASKGGVISNILTWTRDNGAGGMDDLFVVLTTRGQILVYQGIDPSVSSLWNLIGVFDVGEPVAGPGNMVRVGPDLILICTDGYRPLSDYLATGRSQMSSNNLSRNISGLAREYTAAFGTNPGWQAIFYPKKTMMIVNVPSDTIGTNTAQHVANTTTGAWCWFSGIQARAWGMLGDDMYCAVASGKIYRFDTSTGGDGDASATSIQCQAQTAYQSLHSGTGMVRTATVTPIMGGYLPITFSMRVAIDYEVWDGALTGMLSGVAPAQSLSPQTTNRAIIPYAAIGHAASVCFYCATINRPELLGFRVTYEVGSMV